MVILLYRSAAGQPEYPGQFEQRHIPVDEQQYHCRFVEGWPDDSVVSALYNRNRRRFWRLRWPGDVSFHLYFRDRQVLAARLSHIRSTCECAGAAVPQPHQPKLHWRMESVGVRRSPPKPCQLYSPGLYTGGIDVKNETWVSSQGLYYINGGDFQNSANGHMMMATGFPSDPATGAGMVVYHTGTGTFDVGANSKANLIGSDAGSIYKGILFFQDRNSPANTGIGGSDVTPVRRRRLRHS